MDLITIAVVTVLPAGAMGSLTDTAKTAIADGYNKLKTLVTKKCGAKSDIVQAIAQLEAKPESVNRKGMLQEEIITKGASYLEEHLQGMLEDEGLLVEASLVLKNYPRKTVGA